MRIETIQRTVFFRAAGITAAICFRTPSAA